MDEKSCIKPDQISQKCRAIALEEYSLELQAKRYIDLYNNILENF
ncbi:hypothetical protein ACE1AT_19980 [Pelatocladus sp. BLCC-F211]